MTWALGLPENMTDNELFAHIQDHPDTCACEGCREYFDRVAGLK